MIVCEFVLTNTGEDRSIAIQRPQPLMVGETRVIDDAGREFTAKRLRLANKENPSRIHTHAVKGVPMQLQITFAPGAQASKEVKLLEVDGWDDGIASRLAFQFRDLPLLK